MPQPPALTWDVFCQVIDNHGDLGVCWRLARNLAARGQRVRLWVDDASALAWMAPGATEGAFAGIEVLPWTRPIAPEQLARRPRADVWVEAFGCEIAPEFIAHYAMQTPANGQFGQKPKPPAWINLEYLSAEPYVERMHGLPSPVLHGPAAGWTKRFFYPGFTPATGGLLRESDGPARQAAFDRAAWRQRHGVPPGALAVSLFCYEPPALGQLLTQLGAGQAPWRLLVTAGRATAAVHEILSKNSIQPAPARREQLSISYLPYLPQTDYDELLWACDLNFVRGEDSLVRALWAGQPFVWHIYPQQDGAHHAKLAAFLDWLQAPGSLRSFHHAWNGTDPATPLQLPDAAALADWARCAAGARQRLLGQPDLARQLLAWVAP